MISPRDTYEEVDAKVAAWLDAGAELVWVINPRRQTVAVHSGDGEVKMLSATDELTGSTVLPGFACPVAGLFP